MEHTLPQQSDGSDAVLVLRAQNGDMLAFEALARRYRIAVTAMTFARIGNREEAEDLTQEILVRAWQNLLYLMEPTAFAGWLKAIAANACRTWFRKSRPPQTSLYGCGRAEALPDPCPSAFEVVLARERERGWRQALLTLPEANRLALLMHIWGGCSYEEIAGFAGVPLTTVEGRIHRARKQMQRLLNSRECSELLGESRRLWQEPKGKTP